MSPPLLTLSLNEVLFYFTRAAVGVGAPYGPAEDFGRWAFWLASGGMDPAEACAPALQFLATRQSSLRLSLSERNGGALLESPQGRTISAIAAGSFACDWIMTADRTSGHECRLSMGNVDSPFLIAAAVGSSGCNGWSVSWKTSLENHFLVYRKADGNWEASWNGDVTPKRSGPARVSINSAEAKDPVPECKQNRKRHTLVERLHVLETGVAVYDSWQVIHAFFQRCLVPSTEESRKAGAGAGLINTD